MQSQLLSVNERCANFLIRSLSNQRVCCSRTNTYFIKMQGKRKVSKCLTRLFKMYLGKKKLKFLSTSQRIACYKWKKKCLSADFLLCKQFIYLKYIKWKQRSLSLPAEKFEQEISSTVYEDIIVSYWTFISCSFHAVMFCPFS